MSTSPSTSYHSATDNESIQQSYNDSKNPEANPPEESSREMGEPPNLEYKLYRRRFVGLSGMIALNIVGGMSWPWFGSIANDTARQFNISLSKVNWLGNIVSCVYLPTALLLPYLVRRFGFRRCCDLGAVFLVVSAWVRYGGTPRSLDGDSAYALLMLGQAFAGISQAIYQVLGPIYSDRWFDLDGRTTATMLCSMGNPVGSAIGQLLSNIGDVRDSLLVLAIVCSVATPLVFLVQSAPPTPPTFSAAQKAPPFRTFAKMLIGKSDEYRMARRDRLDFVLLCLIFGIMVAAANTFSLLTDQVLAPYGYSDGTSGLMGATLLLSGLVAACISAPLFDKILTHHLAITAKILVPCLGGAWLSLIWAVNPDNDGLLYVIMVIIGVSSLTLMPIALELGSDLTRNAEASSSLLWFMGNLFGVIFVIVQDQLRADQNASPPLNMRSGLIFNGVMAMAGSVLVMPLRGKQVRRELDEKKRQEYTRDVPLRGA
ncbi:hypothetical protein VNI00_004333 [Paramarasmius palmivorus]|uniref:MFS general substrate transporter n=1 Tax=Paramarasmius palmivorus TaxID=297713 RepID=A0AAW0DMJ9_9AGAR